MVMQTLIFDSNNKVSGYSYRHIIRNYNDVVEVEATGYTSRMAYDLYRNTLYRIIYKINEDLLIKGTEDNEYKPPIPIQFR